MKLSTPGCRTLGFCAALSMLAGCGAGNGAPMSPSAAGPAERMHLRAPYSVIHTFEGPPSDGSGPYAGLVNVNGTFYGTTGFGGEWCVSSFGCGTVFSVTPSGTEKVIYSFGKGNSSGFGDGQEPTDDPIAVGGTLYGTTTGGGTSAAGTVFAVTPSGTETVLHNFKGPDGYFPYAGLININKTLYGTTEYGGANGDGTVFSVTTSGKERVIYSFGAQPDGAEPAARLLNVNGTLYGTTQAGGNAGCASNRGCGTVFSVTTAGVEHVLYRFQTGTDGQNPFAGLIDVNGTLYGTTQFGGTSGDGTVFAVTTSGSETVLYSFKGPTDGADPHGHLLEVNGTLYGTTLSGGSRCQKHGGCGTIFSITTSGEENVVHSFGASGGGGAYPTAALLNFNGTLYGTTLERGQYDGGTIFALTP